VAKVEKFFFRFRPINCLLVIIIIIIINVPHSRTAPFSKMVSDSAVGGEQFIARGVSSVGKVVLHQQKRFLVIAASQGLLYLIVYVTPVSISDSLSSNL
jgi:hypothetical protein